MNLISIAVGRQRIQARIKRLFKIPPPPQKKLSFQNTNFRCQRNLIVVIGVLVCLTACSPYQNYDGSNISADFVATDVASCRKKANVLMDRERRLDQSYDRTGSDSLEIAFAQFDLHKQRGVYFDNCLSSL